MSDRILYYYYYYYARDFRNQVRKRTSARARWRSWLYYGIYFACLRTYIWIRVNRHIITPRALVSTWWLSSAFRTELLLKSSAALTKYFATNWWKCTVRFSAYITVSPSVAQERRIWSGWTHRANTKICNHYKSIESRRIAEVFRTNCNTVCLHPVWDNGKQHFQIRSTLCWCRIKTIIIIIIIILFFKSNVLSSTPLLYCMQAQRPISLPLIRP